MKNYSLLNMEELESLYLETISRQDYLTLIDNELVGSTYYYGTDSQGISDFSFDLLNEDGKLVDDIEIFVIE